MISRSWRTDCFFMVLPYSPLFLKPLCVSLSLFLINPSNLKKNFWPFLYFSIKFWFGIFFHLLKAYKTFPLLVWRSLWMNFTWILDILKLRWKFFMVFLIVYWEVPETNLLIFYKMFFLLVLSKNSLILIYLTLDLHMLNSPFFLI